jgi:Flp pilus assembly protein TadG
VHRNRPDDRGASLVEFALVVPLLTLFLFGIIQFGLAYDMKQSINSAAREGARMAAIPDEVNVTYSSIDSRVASTFNSMQTAPIDQLTVVVVDSTNPAITRKTCTTSGCTPASVPVSVSPCTGQAGQTVVVTATKKHDVTIPFYGVLPIELVGRGEFRCEIDA